MLDWLDAHGNSTEVFGLAVQGKTLEVAMQEVSASVGNVDKEKPAKRQRKNVMQKSDATKEELRHKLSDEISKLFVSWYKILQGLENKTDC